MLPRHDAPDRFVGQLAVSRELGAELERQGLLGGVLSLLGAGEPAAAPFLEQMISDTICSDLMDYLRRDALFTGLQVHYDERIAGYFKICPESGRLFVDCEKQGLVREDMLSEILRMLQARYYFSERVYYHHAKIAAGAMVARVVESALLSDWITLADLYDATDEGLLVELRRRLGEVAGGGDAMHGAGAAGDGEGAASEARNGLELLDRLASRRLYKRVAVFPWAENQGVQDELIARFFSPEVADSRRAWERERAAEFKQRFGRDVDVLLYCPSRRMQLKEIGTLVRFPGEDDLLPLSHFRNRLPRIADLEDSYLRLWKVYVFSSAVDPDERRFLQARVREALPDAVDAYRVG